MSNEINELMVISRNTLASINGLSEQMGVINNRLGALESDTASIKDRMQTYEDEQRVTRSQAQTIRRAIHQRVDTLLGITYKGGIVTNDGIADDTFYKPKFISKCYADSRKYSNLGTPYYETFRKDYVSVLDYIGGWAPQVGVAGYKAYLDKRHLARR